MMTSSVSPVAKVLVSPGDNTRISSAAAVAIIPMKKNVCTAANTRPLHCQLISTLCGGGVAVGGGGGGGGGTHKNIKIKTNKTW